MNWVFNQLLLATAYGVNAQAGAAGDGIPCGFSP